MSNPAHPVEIGSLNTPGGAGGLDVAGNRAYVVNGDYGLRIIDVSTPSHPVEIGVYTGVHNVQGVAVRGAVAYVADHWSGLHMIDVSNPAATMSWAPMIHRPMR